MLKIGNLKLNSNLILAPMAGVSDLPFRLLNRKFGCELAFVEMLNCRSVTSKSKRTKLMLTAHPQDSPLGLQLLGAEEKNILKAMEVTKKHKFDILDFNAACPVKKVVRRGEGSALLKEPKKLNMLLKIVVENSHLPVTVKIRIGWDKESVNIKEIVLAVQDAGASAIFIHGRTKIQECRGEVDYKAIREAKSLLKIPVIASGNILSPQLAKKMFDETGCDGLLVARGALGNPWIFEQIKEFLKSGVIPKSRDKAEIIKTMVEHLDSCVDFYGERVGVVIFRKFFSWYTRGIYNSRPIRERVSFTKTRSGMLKLFEELKKSG